MQNINKKKLSRLQYHPSTLTSIQVSFRFLKLSTFFFSVEKIKAHYQATKCKLQILPTIVSVLANLIIWLHELSPKCTTLVSLFCLFICLFVCSFVHSFIYLFIYLFIHSFIYIFVCSFVYFFLSFFLSLFINLSILGG